MACLAANNAYGTLSVSIDVSSTTITLSEGEGARFPSPVGSDFFVVTVFSQDNAMEIMYCTARDGDVLTVQRAQEGTTAIAFPVGARVENRFTAGMFSWLTTYVMEALVGKQDTLVFDSTPTVGSTNPVTSNGIVAALSNVINSIPTPTAIGGMYFFSSNTFVVPTGVYAVKVRLCGGGGGGGSNSYYQGGRGGTSSFGLYISATGGSGGGSGGSAGSGAGGSISTNVGNSVGMYGYGNAGYSSSTSGQPGGYAEGIFSVTPGQSIYVTVGGGGAAYINSNWQAYAGAAGLCIVEW